MKAISCCNHINYFNRIQDHSNQAQINISILQLQRIFQVCKLQKYREVSPPNRHEILNRFLTAFRTLSHNGEKNQQASRLFPLLANNPSGHVSSKIKTM